MITDAVKSVVTQDYRPIKIAIIDDGSTDNLQETLSAMDVESWDAPGEVVIDVFVNDQPTGPSAARNRAIRETWEGTDLFMMLDADDLYLPGKISKSVTKFQEDPDRIGIVYTDALIHNIRMGTTIHEYRQPYDRAALERECIISNTPLVSKAALAKSGGYDEEMRTCEDWDLWLRITKNFVAMHIPQPLHVYHVTGKNSTDIVPIEVWQQNWQRIYQKHAQSN
jgi:glycosyltransferase involved in cell wall biosynthesis